MENRFNALSDIKQSGDHINQKEDVRNEYNLYTRTKELEEKVNEIEMTNLITNLRNQNTDLDSDFGAVKRKLDQYTKIEQLKNELKDKGLKLEGLEA